MTGELGLDASPDKRLCAAVRRYGREAVAFHSFEPGIEVWCDEATGCLVPYLDTGAAWVGVGLPLAPESALTGVAGRFADAGKTRNRRVSWFAAETRPKAFPALLIGQQPEWRIADWPETLNQSRSLREQLRRSRAAGVTVRQVDMDEVREGSPLRRAVDILAAEWLRRRHLEPMGFLVTVAPWKRPSCHRYFMAQRSGHLLAFLSAVPIPARNGWLFEDLLRSGARDLRLRITALRGQDNRTHHWFACRRPDQHQRPRLPELARLADQVGKRVATMDGTGDVRIELLIGAPTITAKAERSQMARYGVRVADAFAVIQGARQGVKVGTIYEGEKRFELRVHMPIAEPTAESLGELFVESSNGITVPLREVVALSEGDGIAAVRREGRQRTVRVDVNLRGRDLVSWVAEARAAVKALGPLKSGYEVGWGGQFENFERAKRRLVIVVPAAIVVFSECC